MDKTGKEPLSDRFGRRISYLRVSVTDRCNHRCTYCAPLMEKFKKREEILSFDEIKRIIRLMAGMGVTKVRLTGGEPLVRKDVEILVEMLSKIPGIEDITMTTNASLLSKLARPLKESGLKRVNISLDTLRAGRARVLAAFDRVTGVLQVVPAAAA